MGDPRFLVFISLLAQEFEIKLMIFTPVYNRHHQFDEHRELFAPQLNVHFVLNVNHFYMFVLMNLHQWRLETYTKVNWT